MAQYSGQGLVRLYGKTDCVMDYINRLTEAIEAGEIIRITYDGGSRPGDSRDISPIRIRGAMLHARCLATDRFKIFAISKIRDITSPQEIKTARPLPYTSIQNYLDVNAALLEALGWHIHSGDNLLTLHRHGKSGRLLKTPDISLTHETYRTEMIVDLDMELSEIEIERTFPWVLHCKRGGTSAFGHLHKALERLTERARQNAPR